MEWSDTIDYVKSAYENARKAFPSADKFTLQLKCDDEKLQGWLDLRPELDDKYIHQCMSVLLNHYDDDRSKFS